MNHPRIVGTQLHQEQDYALKKYRLSIFNCSLKIGDAQNDKEKTPYE